MALGLLHLRLAADGYSCLNTALCFYKAISVWQWESTNDAFRVFTVLGKVGVSLSQGAGDTITLLLYPLPLAHSSAQGYVGLVLVPPGSSVS